MSAITFHCLVSLAGVAMLSKCERSFVTYHCLSPYPFWHKSLISSKFSSLPRAPFPASLVSHESCQHVFAIPFVLMLCLYACMSVCTHVHACIHTPPQTPWIGVHAPRYETRIPNTSPGSALRVQDPRSESRSLSTIPPSSMRVQDPGYESRKVVGEAHTVEARLPVSWD